MHYPTDNELHDIYLSHSPTVQELEKYRVYCDYKSTLRNLDLKLEATKTIPTIIPMKESISDEVFIQLLQQTSDYDTLARGLIEAI